MPAFYNAFDMAVHLPSIALRTVVFAFLFAASRDFFIPCRSRSRCTENQCANQDCDGFQDSLLVALANVETNGHGEIETVFRHVRRRQRKRLRSPYRIDRFLSERGRAG